MDALELPFALRFVDGRGVLGLHDHPLFDLLAIERLELTVPGLRFPVDVSGGAAPFATRRCDLDTAELRLGERELQAWIDRRERLHHLGLFELRLRCLPGRIELCGRARVGDREAPFSTRVTVATAGEQRLCARFEEVRAYAFLPAPAPLLALGLALGLDAQQSDAAPWSVRGTGELSCNPLELLLWHALPQAGWRLPRYRQVRLLEARVEAGALRLRYGKGEAARAVPQDEGRAAAEALLAAGDLEGALAAFAPLPGPEAAERRLAILSSLPDRFAEAETLGARLAAEHPERPQPLLCLAAIETERGLLATAAARYVKLAQLAERAEEATDARLAARRAGELWAKVAPREAIPWLERTLAAEPADDEAAAQLAAAYAADERWQELLRLLRWQLTQTEDPIRQVALRTQLARLWLEELGDPAHARDEVERALRHREDDPELWQLYARALEDAGEKAKAREALARAATRLEGGERAQLELHASRLAEEAGGPQALDEALAHARAALTTRRDVATLSRTATLLARLKRREEAVTTFEEAVTGAEAAGDEATAAELLLSLAHLFYEQASEPQRARAYVERALALCPSQTALCFAAELAREEHRQADLAHYLGLLAEGGDREARLEQAEVLLAEARFAEAAVAAEAVAASLPTRGYAVLEQAHKALGQPRERRAALERLIDALPPATAAGAEARLSLATLLLQDGDRAAACALLWEVADKPASAAAERQALEQLASLGETNDDDLARRDEAWGRLGELRPTLAERAQALLAQAALRRQAGRMAEALVSFRAALALAPEEGQARRGVGETAMALERWDEARAALEPLFRAGERGALGARLGELAERQGRPDEALPYYEAALRDDDDPARLRRAYHALCGVSRRRGDWETEAALLLRAVEDPRLEESDAVRAGRLVAAADLRRKRGGQVEEAVALYERALQLDPLQLVALDALEVLAAGDNERVAQLLGRKLAAMSRRPAEQKAILGRLAKLQLELSRPDAARAAYTRALELDPTFRPALRWLAADARERGAAAEELAMLERLVILPADAERPETLPEMLGRLGALYAADERLDAAEYAARRALELSPREPSALAVLEGVLAARGECEERAQILALRAEVEPDARFDLLLRRAELLQSAGEARLAQEACRQLVNLRPSSAAAWRRLAALLPPEEARGLEAQIRQLLRQERRFDELVAALDEAAAQATSAEVRLELELEAAEALARDLGAGLLAGHRYAALFDRHPQRRDLLARAREAYVAAQEPIYALAIVDRELALARAAAPSEVTELRITRGELLVTAGAEAEAEVELAEALAASPQAGRAHAALAALKEQRGDLAGALEHLIAAAEASDLLPRQAASCALAAAEVLLREGDATTAERLYQRAATLDLTDRRPLEALARLAGARGEPEEEVELLGHAAALIADRSERARLLLNRARLFLQPLDRELDAYRAFKEAVACDPQLIEAVRGLRELAERREEWALAAEQRYAELRLCPAGADPRQRAALHLGLAQLLEERLFDSAAALRNYEAAAELLSPWPTEVPSAAILRLYAEAQRFDEAARLAERWADAMTGPDDTAARADLLTRAGELHARAGDEERARQRLAEAAVMGGEAHPKADALLLRLVERERDPEALRQVLEQHLARAPKGELRLELQRRLLALAEARRDAAAVDPLSQEILAQAPSDLEAFAARKRLLEARGDHAKLADLYRQRAAAITEPQEQAERRFEAGRLAEERLQDLDAAAVDYAAALAADPAHLMALDALADLAYRTRRFAQARALYAQLGDRPSALPEDEICRRRAALAEEAGELEEAHGFYQRAVAHNPSDLVALEAAARLMRAAGDDEGAYRRLQAALELLPLDAVDRLTELRQRLGELAHGLGRAEEARHYYELVLAQLPMEPRALAALARLHVEQAAWPEAAQALGRLSRVTQEPAERADLLFRQGEVLRLGLGDLAGANDIYLQAIDLCPTHAPTLRRLVAYYYGEGDFVSLKEVARDLEQLGQPLAEVAPEAGLGLCLGGDEARGTVVLAVARPTAARLAELIGLGHPPTLTALDAALRAAGRAITGDRALEQALTAHLTTRPAAALALARLHDLGGAADRARVYYAISAFIEPEGLGSKRLVELGPLGPFELNEAQAVHPSARGPLREALTALGPRLLGFSPTSRAADPAPDWTEVLRPLVAQLAGALELQAAVAVDLPEPAWAEPTRPARLLLSRRVLADAAVARFAAARALHALLAGVPLVEGRDPEDVAALLSAATSLFLPDLALLAQRRAPPRDAAFVDGWRAELQRLALDPETLPVAERARLEVALATASADAHAAAQAASYVRAERLTADRVAYAATGDLRAALVALCPAATLAERAAALAEPPLAELVAFALSRT